MIYRNDRYGNKISLLGFGDIVIVDERSVGVICKTWQRSDGSYFYEVYVRLANHIIEYDEDKIERFRIRHKYLSDEEMEWQWG